MSGHHHGKIELKPEQVELKDGSTWKKLGPIGLALGAVCLGAAFAMKGSERPELAKYWTSYLTAFMTVLGLGLGGFFFVIIHHITRAKWGIVLRRLAEHMMFALPFIGLMGLPLLFMGSHSVFEWTHTELVAKDPMLSAKVAYLNEGAAKVRYLIYLAIWFGLGISFWRWSTSQDKAKGDDIAGFTHKMRWLAPLSIIGFAASLSFGAFDFMMSLDPHWFSTIFGVYYFSSSVLSTFAFLVIIAALLQRSGYLNGVVTAEHYHDLGKFMFGFTVFWAYIGFSQYFLIWYADIPEETYFFSYRGHGQVADSQPGAGLRALRSPLVCASASAGET